LPNAVVDVDSVDLLKSRLQTIFACPKMLNNDYTVNLANSGDRSEYDMECDCKVVVVFQE